MCHAIFRNLSYIQNFVPASPQPLYYPFPRPTGNHWFILYICESAFFVIFTNLLCYFLDSTYKW